MKSGMSGADTFFAGVLGQATVVLGEENCHSEIWRFRATITHLHGDYTGTSGGFEVGSTRSPNWI